MKCHDKVKATCMIHRDDLIVTVESLDVNLSKFGFNASITTYDFTRGSGVRLYYAYDYFNK